MQYSVGKRDKEVALLEVRNKFCSVCAKGIDKEHDCFKNWEGTAMECDNC